MAEISDPYPLDLSSDDDKHSLFYALLPKLVRSRLHRIPSIRRSIHQYSRSYSYDSSTSDGRRSSAGVSELSTPPPEYRSRVSLSEPVSNFEYSDDVPSPERPVCSSSTRSGGSVGCSGVKWKFANQGIGLLNVAAEEESRRPRRRKSNANTLSRQLYVHGLTYLLRGLPTNLSTEEKISIWSSVPAEVHELSSESTAVVRSRATQDDGPQDPSLLHKALAACVVRMFLVLQFLIPYLKVFFTAAYKFERQHHLSEQLLSSSMYTMEGMMKTSAQLGNAICRMNNGKVGQAINDATVYWITGVTGGIHQGVGEGLVLLGFDNTGKAKRVNSGE